MNYSEGLWKIYERTAHPDFSQQKKYKEELKYREDSPTLDTVDFS